MARGEHALACALGNSPHAGQIFLEPYKSIQDIERLADFAKAHSCFTVVGQDLPLSDGIVDRFKGSGLLIFGPTQEGDRGI